MARVLVLEPDADTRQLFTRMLRRLGHEPLVLGDERAGDCDAILVEPAWAAGVEQARRLSAGGDAPPIVVASLLPAGMSAAPLPAVRRRLGKPFTLVQLADAIAEAVASPRRP